MSGTSSKIKECLKKLKTYYGKYDIDTESEVQPLQDNTLNIKFQVNYNKKMHSG